VFGGDLIEDAQTLCDYFRSDAIATDYGKIYIFHIYLCL
jgi:hypothetical protein